MATIRITNLTTSAYWLSDLYASVPASTAAVPYVDVTRSLAELAAMRALASAVAAGTLSVNITPSAGELATDLTYIQPLGSELVPGSVTATAMATNSVGPGTFVPVAAAGIVSPTIGIYKAFAAGAGGSADDVTIYAVNTLPYKIRIVDAVANVSTAVGGSTLRIFSAAAAGGTRAALMSGAATGTARATALGTGNVSVVLTPGASVGLFINRSDSGVAGEVFITARKES